MDPDEYTIATLDEAFVYKIPPRNAATGPKCVNMLLLRHKHWNSEMTARKRNDALIAPRR